MLNELCQERLAFFEKSFKKGKMLSENLITQLQDLCAEGDISPVQRLKISKKLVSPKKKTEEEVKRALEGLRDALTLEAIIIGGIIHPKGIEEADEDKMIAASQAVKEATTILISTLS